MTIHAALPARSLLEVVQDSMREVGMLRHPTLAEFRERMAPVIEAMGWVLTQEDRITDLSLTETDLIIDYTYIACGCSDRGSYTIPLAVITAVNPIAGATRYCLVKGETLAQERVNRATRELNAAHAALLTARTALEAHVNAVSEADVTAALEHISGVHNEAQMISALGQLRIEVVRELAKRGHIPSYYKQAHNG